MVYFMENQKKEQMDDLGVPYLRHPDIYIYEIQSALYTPILHQHSLLTESGHSLLISA
jgi:hypothetical protein